MNLRIVMAGMLMGVVIAALAIAIMEGDSGADSVVTPEVIEQPRE